MVTRLVDEVDIAAEFTGHRVGTTLTVEQVDASAADEVVHQSIAVALQGRHRIALQHQDLDVRRQRVVGRRDDGVGALAGVLEHAVAAVDQVGVVAGAAHKHIGADAAIKDIAAAVAVNLCSPLPVPLRSPIPCSIKASTFGASV